MVDREEVIAGIDICLQRFRCGEDCPYYPYDTERTRGCMEQLRKDTLSLLKEQEKEIKALRLLVEWAEECDFGYDSFPDEYERYKDEIEDMGYIDGMIHIAKRTLEECC